MGFPDEKKQQKTKQRKLTSHMASLKRWLEAKGEIKRSTQGIRGSARGGAK